jgi:hypothetical protein
MNKGSPGALRALRFCSAQIVMTPF